MPSFQKQARSLARTVTRRPSTGGAERRWKLFGLCNRCYADICQPVSAG